MLTQMSLAGGPSPVVPDLARVEGVGVRALDRRRVDVAVDLTPCVEPLSLELVIVGPGGEELCSTSVVQNRETMLDKVLHLRRDAEPGEHTLHVGLFLGEQLLDHAVRLFEFPEPGRAEGQGT